jgi:hypothetical protein
MVEYPPGWNCKRAAEQFTHYLLGVLLLRDALAVADHLEACNECLEMLVFYRLTLTERPRG